MFLITYKHRNYAKTVVFHHYRATLAWVTDPKARNLEHTDRLEAAQEVWESFPGDSVGLSLFRTADQVLVPCVQILLLFVSFKCLATLCFFQAAWMHWEDFYCCPFRDFLNLFWVITSCFNEFPCRVEFFQYWGKFYTTVAQSIMGNIPGCLNSPFPSSH